MGSKGERRLSSPLGLTLRLKVDVSLGVKHRSSVKALHSRRNVLSVATQRKAKERNVIIINSCLK